MKIDRLEEIFITVAAAHLQIKTVTRGLDNDLALTGDEVYGLFHLMRPWVFNSTENTFYGGNIANFNIQGSFMVLDKPETPMSNYTVADLEPSIAETLEKTRSIATDIIEYINTEYENELGFTSVTFSTVQDYTENRDCGILVEFTLKVVNAVNKCDVNDKFEF
jgi:hypothetical protein